MKQSKRIPRRVASSLVKSLGELATRLNTALSYVDSRNTYISESYNQTNAKIFRAEDGGILESIIEFNDSINTKIRRGDPIADDAFVTVAKHKDLRVRYVATGTSVGLVITTGCLKRILHLSTNIIHKQNWINKNESVPAYVCESPERGYSSTISYPPNFLRLLDILKFMEETENDMLEISLNGIEKDMAAHDNLLSQYSHSNNASTISRYFPILSDRYQHESWKHYLSTLYSGLVKDISLFSP